MRHAMLLTLLLSTGCGHMLAEMRAEEASEPAETDSDGPGTLDSVAWSADHTGQRSDAQAQQEQRRVERQYRTASAMRVIGNSMSDVRFTPSPMPYVAPYQPPPSMQPIHCSSYSIGQSVYTNCQ